MAAAVRAKQFITDGDITADFTSDPIPCLGYDELEIDLEISGESDPEMNVSVQGRLHPDGEYDNLPIDRIAGVGATLAAAGDTAIAVSNGSSESRIKLTIASPPRHCRVFCDVTAAGAATGLQGRYTLKKWNLP